ncbi:MAG TPA: K(+)-transporting ATPase subunit C [Puia sp.]|nr:K(+)-transporting ATPase subunit C [Puia sp.]
MKQHILPALKLTFVCIIFFCGMYTLIILGIAQFGPNKGNGETISVNNRVIGYKLEGQNFNNDKYFWSRPSAVGYNAAGSGGSNKGPSNPDYLKDVQSRIDTFFIHNPNIRKEDIPSELVTSSGSGLDPDLSPGAAYIQVARIAKARNLDQSRVKSLVDANIEKPLFGLLGPQKVNVLKLNIELDKLN